MREIYFITTGSKDKIPPCPFAEIAVIFGDTYSLLINKKGNYLFRNSPAISGNVFWTIPNWIIA